MDTDEASEILHVFRPRVIVLELVLPCMSGLLFARRVKSDPASQNIVIIAVTAFKGAETEWATRSAGCSAFAQKPIDMPVFAALIQAHLALVET